MPNIGGSSSEERAILRQVVLSIILYGAPIGHRAVEIRKYSNMLKRIQMRMNIKVICTWTISGEAEGVNAGATPIKLMIQERVRIQERKKAAEEINERLRKMEKYKIIIR